MPTVVVGALGNVGTVGTLHYLTLPYLPQYTVSQLVENKGLQCVYSQGGHGNGIGD